MIWQGRPHYYSSPATSFNRSRALSLRDIAAPSCRAIGKSRFTSVGLGARFAATTFGVPLAVEGEPLTLAATNRPAIFVRHRCMEGHTRPVGCGPKAVFRQRFPNKPARAAFYGGV